MSRTADRLALTPSVRIEKVAVLVNTASGGVGPDAALDVAAILQRFDLVPRVYTPEPRDIPRALRAAVEGAPDLLVVLAGDGTARAAAALCGPGGPLIAPLAGGTMNLLPHALYGRVSWRSALTDALSEGVERTVSGGRINDAPFFVAAILGPPALWAPAREAARRRRLARAWKRARLALRAAFAGRLRYTLDDQSGRASALTLMCPLVSRAMSDETGLEAVVIDPFGAGEIVRVGFRALAMEVFGPWAGDWRDDPIIHAGVCHSGHIRSKASIPAVLDGEPMWFSREAAVSFTPDAFRALARPGPIAVAPLLAGVGV